MYHVNFNSGTAGEGKNKMSTLKRMMRIAEPNEPWTIGTEDGQGWLFYFDGEIIHPGTDVSYEELLKGATDARIIAQEGSDKNADNERRFAEIVADCPQDVVDLILEMCRQAVIIWKK
jgi:hypothetical protein